MFSIRRRNSTLNQSGPPRRPEPTPMVVRSQRLREQGGCLVHDLAELREACPDAHPADIHLAETMWMSQPTLVIRLVPGR
jgi:hypothetical protein